MKINNTYQNHLIRVAVRTTISAPIFVLGWYLVESSGGELYHSLQVVAGMGCFIGVAAMVGPSLAGLLSLPWARMFYRPGASDRPASRAIYRVAEIRRSQGRYDEAMREYEKISEQFPHELTPWIEMMDIVDRYYDDRSRVLSIFRKGMAVLTEGRDREELKEKSKTILTGLKQRDHISPII